MRELTPDQLFDRMKRLNQQLNELEEYKISLCDRIENIRDVYHELTKPGFKHRRFRKIK
jgi:uncharacterized protein (UPF0335 family)